MENKVAELWAKMKIHKITQCDIAKHLNVTNDYVSMIMRGTDKTTEKALSKIENAINELIGESK